MALAYLTENSTTLAAAAWSDVTGFAANATLIIDRTTSQAITTAVDQSAVAQVDYLKIGRGFSGTIGSAASPLKFGALAASLNAKGFFNDSSGVVFIQAANIAGAGSANTIAYYSKSGTGRDFLIGGAFTTIDCASGYIEVGQGCTNTTFNITGGEAFIDYNASAGTTLNIFSGKVHSKRVFTNIYNYGGTLIYDAGNITLAVCTAAGFWDHRNGDVATMTIAGTFTVQNLNRSCTIGGTALTTTANANINRTTSSTVSATFSNETKIAGGPQTGYSASAD